MENKMKNKMKNEIKNQMKSKVNDVKEGALNPTLDYCRSNHTPEESVLLWSAYIYSQCKGLFKPVEYYEYKYNRGAVLTHDIKTWEAFDYIDGEIAKENAASNPLEIDGFFVELNDDGEIEEITVFPAQPE